jgi:hypothetical protein
MPDSNGGAPDATRKRAAPRLPPVDANVTAGAEAKVTGPLEEIVRLRSGPLSVAPDKRRARSCAAPAPGCIGATVAVTVAPPPEITGGRAIVDVMPPVAGSVRDVGLLPTTAAAEPPFAAVGVGAGAAGVRGEATLGDDVEPPPQPPSGMRNARKTSPIHARARAIVLLQ